MLAGRPMAWPAGTRGIHIVRKILLAGSCSFSLILGGCMGGGGGARPADTPPAPPSLVPVSGIVNAIKCELADTFAKHPDLYDSIEQDEKNEDIKAELTLSDTVSRATSGEGGVEFSLLGVDIEGSGSASRTRSTGQSVTVGFAYDLDRAGVAVDCTKVGQKYRVQGEPFAKLLYGMSNQYNQLAAGAPKVKLSEIAYESSFEVEQETSAGGKITILIFSIGAERTVTRGSGQTLTLTFPLKYAARFITPD